MNLIQQLRQRLITNLIKILSPSELVFKGGSSILFTPEGDVVVKVKRALVVQSTLTFINNEDEFVTAALEAYEQGCDSYQDFLNKSELDNPMPVIKDESLNKTDYIDGHECTGDCANCACEGCKGHE